MLHVRRLVRSATSALMATALSFHVSSAVAQDETGLDACGNIEVTAEAQCEVVADDLCTGQCEPIAFQAECTAQCEGQCTLEAEVDCTGTCEGSCVGECDVDPGQFDCAAACKGSCEGDCQAACEADANSSECQAACKGRCEGECDAQCEVVPPEADCEAKCQARCDATCTAAANATCEGTCSGECKGDLQGGCELQCQSPDGALFCDGQYVDTGNNLEQCAAAIEELLDIDVEGYASGDVTCEGNACVAEGEAGCSCSAVRPHGGSASAPIALGLALGALFASRRRRSRAV